jgi:hypothetical protein
LDPSLDLPTLNERITNLSKEILIRDEKVQASQRAQDEKLHQMMSMMEKMSADLRQALTGKGTDPGQSSGTTCRHAGSARPGDENDDPIDEEEQFDRRNGRLHDLHTSPKVFLFRLNLSIFDGTKPNDWLENCKIYFNYYQTPRKV